MSAPSTECPKPRRRRAKSEEPPPPPPLAQVIPLPDKGLRDARLQGEWKVDLVTTSRKIDAAFKLYESADQFGRIRGQSVVFEYASRLRSEESRIDPDCSLRHRALNEDLAAEGVELDGEYDEPAQVINLVSYLAERGRRAGEGPRAK